MVPGPRARYTRDQMSDDAPTVADFEFALPEEAIAQRPAARREAARLLVMARVGGPELLHHTFSDLPDLVRGDELFVFNDTRVVPARLRGHKPSGGKVELLALGPADDDPRAFLALGRAAKPLRPGALIRLDRGADVAVELVAALGDGAWRARLPAAFADLWALLEACGEIPLPPYIARPEGPGAEDAERYQTVWAREPGAVAAPTAGLHFSDALLAALTERGCETARVTLHVGPGTFQPVRATRLADHRMHSERYRVSPEAARAIAAARGAGRPVVAVGTTVVRTLEAVAARSAEGEVVSAEGETDVFITPGYRFRVVDQLITNFHLPGSTLLMLVSAFAGRERVLAAYREAIARAYRFYSYGDGMWLR